MAGDVKIRVGVEGAESAARDLADVEKELAAVGASAGGADKAFSHLGGSVPEGEMKSLGKDLEGAKKELSGIASSADKANSAFRRLGDAVSLEHYRHLCDTFQDTGLAINATSREIPTLVSRIQSVARERAFRQLADDANLSQIQIARLRAGMGDYAGAMSSVWQAAKDAKIALAAVTAGAVLFGKSCLDAQIEMQRLETSYKAVFGSAAQGQLQAVYEQADRVGLKFAETAEAAKGFFAAGQGTALEKDLQGIFKAVSDTGAALQLSSDEVNGALVALGQMMSKGKVQAEELRGQLGERIPGAFQMAARAMGMTTAELDKFMADGKLTAEDLLPKLADALEEKYGEAAKNAANTVQGTINRLENEWFRYKQRIIDSGPVQMVTEHIERWLKEGNDAAARDADNRRIDEILRKRGVKPEGNAGLDWYAVSAGLQFASAYTDKQRDEYRALEKEAAAISQKYEETLRKEQAASANFHSLTDKLVQKTAVGKKAAYEKEKKAIEDATQAYLEAAQAEGSSEETLQDIRKRGAMALAQLSEDYEKQSKSGATAAKAAANAAVAQADYAGALKQTQNRIESLQQQLGLDKTENITAQKIKVEEAYREAINETGKTIAKQVAAGKLTGSQANELKRQKELEASLEMQLKLKQLEEKQTQKNVQIAQGQIKFYKELGQLSGNYADTVDLQNLLLQKQADEYRKVYGISEDLIQQWLYFQQLQNSQDPFDGAYRGLLKFQAEYTDSAKEWESIAYNFGKSFMSNTRSMFDDFLETGKASFDSFQNLFKQLLKDLAWQAIAQPIMLSVIGGVVGGGTASAGTGGGTTGGFVGPTTDADGNVVANVSGGIQQMAGKYAMSELFSGSGGLTGGITTAINDAMASWFPNTFASGSFVGPLPQGAATTTFTQQAGSFLSNFAAPGIGASLGSMASPFVNSLLGLENNQGSSIGSTVGGLGATAVLGTLAAANIWNPGGWVMGGIAALGSLLGGGIGSLFGGGKKELPELYINAGANLWDNAGALVQTPAGGAALFNTGDDYYNDSFARAQGAQGTAYSTGQEVAGYLAGIIQSGQEMSAGIADALGSLNSDLKRDYLDTLKERGRIESALYLEGEDITSDRIESFGSAMADLMQEAMIESLSSLDLKPLVKTASGRFASTAEELGKAIGNVISFANLGASIDDEEMRATFTENVIPQMTKALANVSLAPLTKAANGFAVQSVEELSTALTDIFSVYDVSESVDDENIRKAYQQWAQNAIEQAFAGIDLSFLRVDFDKNDFAGLQQAYAAIQAWETVHANIEAVLNPATEFTSQLTAASDQFDAWIANLKALGWQEEAVAEVEAKRADYMRKLANSISQEFAAFMQPASQFEQAMRDGAAQFDDWISNLQRLGYAEEEIIAIEGRRAEYLEQLRASLERSTAQDASSRLAALRYGSSSSQYALQSLLFQQANERESLKSQFGENHYLYQTVSGIQKAELASTLLEQLQAEREKLLQKEQQAAQNRINAEQAALQERSSAIQSEISAANSLANTFRRIVKTLEEYRRDLWSGENNLTGSRYQDTYRQFNELYEKALQGDEDAFNEITGKANELLALGREQLPERGEYNDLFYDVDQKLKLAQIKSEQQLGAAEKQAGLLNSQLAALQGQQNTLNSQLEALQNANDTAEDSLMTLEQIDLGIAALQALIAAQTEEARKTYAQGATISWDWDRLLQEKADSLNSGATWQPGYATSGWTAEKVLANMLEQGLTPQSWYEKYGKDEGFVLKAADSVSGALDSSLSSLDGNLKYYLANNAKLLDSSLDEQLKEALAQGISLDTLNSIEGSYWPKLLENMLGLKTGISTLDSSFLSFAQKLGASAGGSTSGTTTTPSTGGSTSGGSSGSAATTGIYGSKYATEAALVNAKVGQLNRSKFEGRNNWSNSEVRARMAKDFGSIESWYINAGKAEGFARGGITPANTPFWTGENGRELVVSPQRWGVINHEASEALWERVNQPRPVEPPRRDDGEIASLRQQVAVLTSYIRQIVVKTDKTAWACEKIMQIQRVFEQEGIQISGEAQP